MVELRVGNSDQRYQDLVETIKEGILELDQDGCIVFASPPLLKMLDKPSGSLLGQEASEFLNAESISVWREHAHRLPASKCENFVIELLRNDGSLLPVSLSMRVCVDHRGGEGSFCVVSDLTEAQHANQLVRWILNSTASLTGEEFFQALMRNVAEAFCFRYAFITECMDISQTRVRTLVYWNGQDFEPNFEFDLAETPCGATIHGAQTYFVSRGLANVFPYTAALGVEGYLGIPLFDTTFKTVIGHIAFLSRGEIAMDVVEHPFFKIFASRTGAELRRKRAEEQARTVLQQLAHLSRVNSLGEMASGIAHELSQPLSALQTFAHASLRLIASGASSIEELQHTLTRVVVQADRMGEILRRIRSLSKKEEVERRALDVNLLIEEIVDLLSFDAQQSSIELEVDLAENLPAVWVDGIQIQQVILNLVRNSLDAIEEYALSRRKVTIRTRLPAGALFVDLMVCDFGPGVSPADRSRIFDPFFTTKERGMGIGLSISRSIAEAHGGSLRLESSESGGTVFLLTIPLAD